MFQHQSCCSLLAQDTEPNFSLTQDCRSAHDISKVVDSCRNSGIQTDRVWWNFGSELVESGHVANRLQDNDSFAEHMPPSSAEHASQYSLPAHCDKAAKQQNPSHHLPPPHIEGCTDPHAVQTMLLPSNQQNPILDFDQQGVECQWLVRRPRSRMKRRRRHAPGSCIDLTLSDDEVEDLADCGIQAEGPGEQPAALPQGLQILSRSVADRRWSKLENKVCKYPNDDDDAMAIHGEEVRCLAPGAFLNDTIVEFHIRWLQVNWPRPDLPLDSCLFLNSFFYKKLKQLTTAQRLKRHPDGPDFQRLRRWTRGINLLRKQYIFVPIHDAEHWTLAVICFPEEHALSLAGGSEAPASIPTPAILHFDSLGSKRGGHATPNVTRQLKSYLAWEVLQQLASHTPPDPAFSPGTQAGTRSHRPLATAPPSFAADKILVKRVPVPLQTNDFDCGLFLLHNLETFIAIAPATFRVADLISTLQLGRNWYSAEAPSIRRTELLRVLEPMMGVEEEAHEPEHVGTTEVQSADEAERVAEGQVPLEPVAGPVPGDDVRAGIVPAEHVDAGNLTAARKAAEHIAAASEWAAQPVGLPCETGPITSVETAVTATPLLEGSLAGEQPHSAHPQLVPPVPTSSESPNLEEVWATDRGIWDRKDAATTEHAPQSIEAPFPIGIHIPPCTVPRPLLALRPNSPSQSTDSSTGRPTGTKTVGAQTGAPTSEIAAPPAVETELKASMSAIGETVDGSDEGLPAGGPGAAAVAVPTPANVKLNVVDANAGTNDLKRPCSGLKRKAYFEPQLPHGGVHPGEAGLPHTASRAFDVAFAPTLRSTGKAETTSSAQVAGDMGFSDRPPDVHSRLLAQVGERRDGGSIEMVLRQSGAAFNRS